MSWLGAPDGQPQKPHDIPKPSRFILTRHSPLYAEWRAGERPSLKVIEPGWTFGANDLSFEGEEEFERYGDGLEAALDSWMERSSLDRPVRDWFDFRVSRPRIAEDHVAKLAAAAERQARAPAAGRSRKAVWLAGRMIRGESPDGRARLTWAYRNKLQQVELEPDRADALAGAVGQAAVALISMDELLTSMDGLGGEPFETTKAFRKLRRFGLAAF